MNRYVCVHIKVPEYGQQKLAVSKQFYPWSPGYAAKKPERDPSAWVMYSTSCVPTRGP